VTRLSAETSVRIANLGCICMLLVVSIHLSHLPQGIGLDAGIAYWILRYVFATVAVPFFFIVSGYFLSRHAGEPEWWTKACRQRLVTLGVPFLVWCLVPFVLFSVLWTSVPVGGECSRVLGKASSVAAGFGLNVFVAPELNRPLWYVRTLMLLVLLSPLLIALVDRFRGWTVAAALAFWLAVNPGTLCTPDFWLSPRWQVFWVFGLSAEGVAWFTVGVFLRRHPLGLTRRNGLVAGMLGVLIAVLGLWARARGSLTGGYLMEVAIPFTLAGLWTLTPSFRFPTFLCAASFPVYVLHAIFIKVLSVVPFPHGPFAWVLEWGAVVSISLSVTFLLRRFLPRTAFYSFGGR